MMGIVRALFGKRGETYPLRDLNTKNTAAGAVSGLMALTGPPVLILQAASNGGYSLEQAVLWVFATFVFGGLFGIVIPLYYRTPIVGAQTLTGLAFLTTVTPQFSYNELIGAFIVSGLLMLFVGYFGVFSKLVSYVPREIISAMLAGMVVKFMVNLIISIQQLLLVGLASLVAFFVLMKWFKRIPPIIGALCAGFFVLFLTEPLGQSQLTLSFVMPQLQMPEFTLVSIIGVSLPLALLILSNDAAVGIAALQQNKFSPNVNQIISWSGIFSIVTGFFGGQSANIAGMMSAICSDDEAGPKEKRYMGAVVAGVMIIFIGIFAWKILPFIDALPQTFISMFVGFSLLAVFGNSLSGGFSNPSYRTSAALAFAISASNITVLHISAPIWALVVGTLVARLVEGVSVQQSVQKKAS